MMTNSPPDLAGLEAYGFLVRLHAGEMDGKLTSRAVQSYLEASRLALGHEPGDARECLLRTLNSGVNSALRVHELSEALADARAVLKASSPGRAEALQAHGLIGAMLSNLQRKMREAFASERAAGRDPSGTAFFVFDHDMAGVVSDIRRESANLLKLAPEPAADAN